MPDKTAGNQQRILLAAGRLREAEQRLRKLLGGCALLAVSLAGSGCASVPAPWVARHESRPAADLISRVPHAPSSESTIELTAGQSESQPKSQPAKSTKSAKSTAPASPKMGFSSPADADFDKESAKTQARQVGLLGSLSTQSSNQSNERQRLNDRPAPIPPPAGSTPSTPRTAPQTQPGAKQAAKSAVPQPPIPPTAKPAPTLSLAAVRPTVISAARARQLFAGQWLPEKPAAPTASQPAVQPTVPPAPALPAAPVAQKDPQPKPATKAEAKPETKLATKAEPKAEPKTESKAPERTLASRPLRTPNLVKTATPKTPPSAAKDDIAPVGETPEQITPADHDNRLAVNDRLQGRFPTHLPRPRLSQPLASAAQMWRSELQEDTHKHLTQTQRETEGDLAVAPVPGRPVEIVAEAPRVAEAKVQRSPTVKSEQPVAEQAPRHAVVPPKADPPATRPVHDAAADYLRFADRHATRPPAAARAPRPAEFVSALAAQRQAEMASAVQPPAAEAEAEEPEERPATRVARAESPVKPTIASELVKTPKEAIAPTMPLPSPAEGAPATVLERLPAPQVDKNSAYVRAIADWTNESYAGVRNYRTELFHVTAAQGGPLAHRDGVTFRFRKTPLAIHAGWNADPHQGRQWLFAEGNHGDKWFVLEPVASGRMKVLVEQDSLPLGNVNRPVTEWGLGGVIARFERHMSLASEGNGRCLYEGVVRRPELEGTLHEVVYHPTGNGCSVHYYFSTTNLLPRLVELKLDGNVKEAEIFQRLEVNLTDLDRGGAFEASELFKN